MKSNMPTCRSRVDMVRIRYNTNAYCHIRASGHVTAHHQLNLSVAMFDGMRDVITPYMQAMEDLFHIIEKESPPHLSLHRAIALAEQAKYCMADGLMPFLPEYFTPMIHELQPDEVRSL